MPDDEDADRTQLSDKPVQPKHICWLILGVGAAVGVAMWIFGPKTSPESVAAEYAWSACESAVAAQLKAPGTAEFAPPSERRYTTTPSGFEFSSWVDAQNGLGASMRTAFTCRATGSGKSFTATASLG